MVRKQAGEVWKEITFTEVVPRSKYAVSNTGRVAQYTESLDDGRLIKPLLYEGFPGFRTYRDGKAKVHLVHRVMLETFGFPRPDDTHRVIHLDFVKTNNRLSNLKWVNKDDWHAHQNKNPKVIASRSVKGEVKPYQGLKLTATQVALLKKKLFDPERKTRIRLLAKQYGVTEMTLYRIKSGENWSHVAPAP